MGRRSRNIEIGFVSMVAAAALSGCDSQAAYHRDWQQCVDQRNVVVEDRFCDQNVSGGGGPVIPYYHWWYSARPYYWGQTVAGGYAAPRANMEVARASTAARGGFGSSAHGDGGGGE